ncbi:unnamed protein product [marine sediment metagenome]|uniref:Uncharacterized protein n=1 Tax=marine sediment metagenome TaxID=412755 RepID=X0XM00_9ZZZZ
MVESEISVEKVSIDPQNPPQGLGLFIKGFFPALERFGRDPVIIRRDDGTTVIFSEKKSTNEPLDS